jgi:hypothetical protein
MLPEQLPACLLCGECLYDSGGGSWGGGCAQQWFTCRGCDAHVYSVSMGAAYLVYFPSTAYTTSKDNESILRSSLKEWLDEIVFVTLRDFVAREEAAKHRAWLKSLPGFLERHNVQEVQPGCISYHHLPTQEAKDDYDRWSRDSRIQPGFENSPLLAQIPEGVQVYGHDGKWCVQDHEESQKITPPRDPTTVRNAEYWGCILAEIGITDAVESPNRYCGAKNQPWFQFTVADVDFVVGWRKRVVQLSARSARVLDFSSLAELGRRDRVTFSNSWDPDEDNAPTSYVMIHAGSKETCVEYLRAMLTVARTS